MTNIRVHEYAKQHDVQSKLIMNKLRDMGFEVKGHMSVLDDGMIARLDKLFSPEPKDTPKLGMPNKTKSIVEKKDFKKQESPNKSSEKTEKKLEKPIETTEMAKPKKELPKVEEGSASSTKETTASSKPVTYSGRPSRTKQQSSYSTDRPNRRPYSSGSGANRPNQASRPSGTAQGRSTYSGDSQKRDQVNPASQGQTNTAASGTGRSTSNQNRPYQSDRSNRPNQGRPSQTTRPSQGRSQTTRPSSSTQNRPNNPSGGNRLNSGSANQKTQTPSTSVQNTGFTTKKQKTTGRNYVSKKAALEKQRTESKAFGTKKQQVPVEKKVRELPEKITFTESLTVTELGKKLHREPAEIIKKLFMMGVVTTINSLLDRDAIEIICADYGVKVEEIIVIDKTDLEAVIADDDVSANTFERPAVVTIMGHVDHGKTTLLDSIRNTKVTAGEAGGITQHIGAYQVEAKDKKITFLDTPGHAAFTTMRARGAQVTDVTVLVVAADDGVMPQTIEAINHAKAAEVPIIVAVNKIDKPEANQERVKTELGQHGLVPEEWGGDTIFVPVSAKMGQGIDDLLETILLVSEVAELKCNVNRLAIGTVIEAKLDKGRGPVATLLVQNGTLRVGDPIVVGNSFGRVRAMVNDDGKRIQSALPSTPIEITGLNEVPQAGDRFVVFEDEKTARSVGEQRASNFTEATRNEKKRITLDNLFEQLKEGEVKELNIIIKADVQGSSEALASSLRKIEVEGVKIKIVHSGVGAISEYDVLLASASNAIVIGFNVRPEANAKRIADSEKVDIRQHSIIYKVIEEIEQAMKGLLDPEYEEKIIGQAEVRQVIKISKVGSVAGSYITDGKIERGCKLRLIRNDVVIHDGELDALKRFKDDVKTVAAGYECGISFKNFNDINEGDILEAYVMEEIARS